MLETYEVKRQISVVQANKMVGMYLHEEPDALMIAGEGIWVDSESGEPVASYCPFPGDIAAFRRLIRGTPWSTTLRGGSAIRNVSRTFGMAPRKQVMQRESCRPTRIYEDAPEIADLLDRTADELQGWVNENLPDVADEDRATVNPVLPEWRVGEDTIWTSGVINLTSQLPYHRDGANFQAWSAMPVVRRGTRGGRLHLPEYNVSFECRDGWVVWFPGWRYLHGVTPIQKIKRDGYRISVVYYSLRGMKDCHTWALEQAAGREARTKREQGMLRGSPMDPTDASWKTDYHLAEFDAD